MVAESSTIDKLVDNRARYTVTLNYNIDFDVCIQKRSKAGKRFSVCGTMFLLTRN